MDNIITSAVIFLTDSVLNIFVILLLIRLMLGFTEANYFHPLTQFIVRCTNWLIKPTRRIVPNFKRLETASVLWILLIAMLKLFIVNTLTFGLPNPLGILILGIGECLYYACQIYIFAIIIQCLLSFIQPASPANYVLQQFTYPIMGPIRRFCPAVGGMDISPIPAVLLLQLFMIVIVNPLMLYGIGLAY